ncbi:hypothetical protein [Vogesella fluminis]|uniref:Uncharacterized protein n=1 Tax=Vogesella fluminis TaxID=1069161 RepID=A0ABQ3HCQ5_9NEIS|nr:hypothetical protein [Vogesella fluminis]GHD82484.1 hypothetical protein GCM10011419_29950 [Vogesella fluminis]
MRALFSLLLAALLRPTFRTLAVFPVEAEAVRYARERLAEGWPRLTVCHQRDGWAVRLIGGGV